ncbi:DUF4232 domain-containing protein [Streptomyces corynorhini]|uniref:DUF4232 domain-containing protein n=1 Tax=Streptomyces corynorhini TaxID=2282652 RepID=A0A370BAI4_9ACTN|nr:DUF4232 domain-containing protein [Streptomyces corynorhini]RDG36823.1 DUF4232 domain-containing protein [Streptomyces corynorhini]
MRSYLAARSTRVVLAVTATAALATGLTACDDDDLAAGGSSTPAASTTGGSGSSGGSGGSSDKGGTDGGSTKEDGVEQSCGTNDLDFTVAKSDVTGYLLVSAKAKSGISCQLAGSAPLVLFSSAEKTTAYPAELMKKPADDFLKLSGSTTAYATLIPNTTRAEGTPEFKQVDITVDAKDSHTAALDLPGSYAVDDAAVTSWYSSAADSTPDAN